MPEFVVVLASNDGELTMILILVMLVDLPPPLNLLWLFKLVPNDKFLLSESRAPTIQHSTPRLHFVLLRCLDNRKQITA